MNNISDKAWVSNSARVFGDAQVSGNARVFGNALVFGDAQVFGDAKVFGNALVFGNAKVFGNAVVCDNALVSGTAKVFGNAHISGDAVIEKTSDYLVIGPAKSSGRFTTAHRDSKIGVLVSCGCFRGTVHQFSESIEETHKNNQEALEQYRLFCQLIAFNFNVSHE